VLDWATPEHKPAGVIVADYVSGNMNAGERSGLRLIGFVLQITTFKIICSNEC
jgi:hypothetical protein